MGVCNKAYSSINVILLSGYANNILRCKQIAMLHPSCIDCRTILFLGCPITWLNELKMCSAAQMLQGIHVIQLANSVMVELFSYSFYTWCGPSLCSVSRCPSCLLWRATSTCASTARGTPVSSTRGSWWGAAFCGVHGFAWFMTSEMVILILLLGRFPDHVWGGEWIWGVAPALLHTGGLPHVLLEPPQWQGGQGTMNKSIYFLLYLFYTQRFLVFL